MVFVVVPLVLVVLPAALLDDVFVEAVVSPFLDFGDVVDVVVDAAFADEPLVAGAPEDFDDPWVVVEGPWSAAKRGSWLIAVRKSYLQYILNRIDLGDQPPLAFGFTDADLRVDYDLTSRHALSLTYIDGSSAVDRSRFRASLRRIDLTLREMPFRIQFFAPRIW